MLFLNITDKQFFYAELSGLFMKRERMIDDYLK